MMYYNNTNLVTTDQSLLSNSAGAVEERGCESNVLMLIMKIQPIFLILFGFIANLCSFAVLIQPRLRRRPTFSYLAFLSLSNAFLSLIHAFFTIIGVYFGLTLENLSLFIFCRLLNRFLIDFLTHFSLLTLTAVDLDRCRTVTSKTNVQQYHNRQANVRQHGCAKPFIHVCLVEFSFAAVLLCLHLHWLTSYGFVKQNVDSNMSAQVTMCTISDSNGDLSLYGKYLASILPIIELVVFGISPFSISLVATIVILRHLSIKFTSTKAHNKHLKQSRRRIELHLSLLLISLNCVYILFTTPHNIFSIYVGHLHSEVNKKHKSETELCSIAFTQKSLDLLQQCYFMSTFFLYILTNKRFREEFYRLLQCLFVACRHHHTNNSPIEISTIGNRLNINNNNHSNSIYVKNDIMDKSRDHYPRHTNPDRLIAPSRGNMGSCSSISDAVESNEFVSILDNN